jgi:chemotaxis response regulator CheB
VQDRVSCAVFGMPRAALEVGATDLSMPLEQLAAWAQSQTVGVTASTAPAPTVAKRRRILVVDDDHGALEETRRALEAAGYDAHVQDNPMMVAVTLRRTPADLVLLESELVTVSGKVVTDAMRKNGLGHVPVVLHSKLTGDALRARATECGVLGFVNKADPERFAVIRGLIGGPTR